MRAEQREVYFADDGTMFDAEKACQEYEAEIAKRAKLTTYWRVTHNPDLTEGRGHYGALYIECYGPEYDAEVWVSDWCYRTFGRPLAFVQGCAAIESWYLRKIDRDKFLSPSDQRVGDYSHKHEVKRLVIGGRAEGLVEDAGEKAS